MPVLCVNKPIGFSCSQLLEILKNKYGYNKLALTGRLDPLAYGIMIILTDNDTKHLEEHLHYSKKYRTKTLFGFNTDTFDILGLPFQDMEEKNIVKLVFDKLWKLDKLKLEDKIKEIVSEYPSKRLQQYPFFSSICVRSAKLNKRQPLWKWSLDKKLDQIDIPSKMVNIYEINFIKIEWICINELMQIIFNYFDCIKDTKNLRMELIKNRWKNLFRIFESLYPDLLNDKIFPTVDLNIELSSGGYVREIVNHIGNIFDLGGITFEIFRYEIYNSESKYTISDIDKTVTIN